MLPKGWKTVLLDQVAKRGSGHTPSKESPQYWNGGIKWVSLADSSRLDKGWIVETDKEISAEGIQNSSAVVHPSGTVVLSRDAGVGKSGVLFNDMAVSQHFIAWDCSASTELHNWFLYYWLQQHKPEFERVAVGSTIKTIGLPYFKKLKITLPPLEEQLRISDLLAHWDQAIDRAEQLVGQYQREAEDLGNILLTGQRRFGKYPSWQPKPLGQMIRESRVLGSAGDVARKITVKLYGRGVFGKSEKRAGSESTQYYRRHAGQFIYSKLDFLNGAFGRVPISLDGYESTLDLPAFDFLPGVEPRWFLHYVCREAFYIGNLGLANGGRKARRVNPNDLLRVVIATPSLEEQRRIADAIDIAREMVARHELQLGFLLQERTALMSQLLTGRRRVKLPAAESEAQP